MQKTVFVFDNRRCIALSPENTVAINASLIPTEVGSLALETRSDGGEITVDGKVLTPFAYEQVGDKTVMLFEAQPDIFSTVDRTFVRIGNGETCDIILPDYDVMLTIRGTRAELLHGNVYYNGELLEAGSYDCMLGDTFLIGTLLFTLGEETVSCAGTGFLCTLKPAIQPLADREEFPIYKRSPRNIKKPPQDKVEVTKPPQKESRKKGQLAKVILPPLIMLCLTIAVSIFSGRGLFIIISAASMGMSLVFSVTTFFSDKKERKTKEEARVKNYEDYLLSLRKRLYALRKQNEEALHYQNPTVHEIEELTKHYSSRIYERAANDSDFLTLSLGTASVNPNYELSFRKDDLSNGDDPLMEDAETVESEFHTLANMPVTVDLKKAHLGLVGEKHNIHAQLKAMLAQLCFLQSYHDIEIVMLVEEEDKAAFEFIKWYPHCKVKTINISGLIASENQRDQVLGNITQVLKARKLKMEENKKETLFLPHYVFIIDNPKLIINHSIMEYLLDESSTLGFSMIYTTNIQSNLPENIKTIFALDGSEHGTLMMNEGNLQRKIVQTHQTGDVDFEMMARRLCPLLHNKGVTTQIPESITFFDLYGVKKPEELPVKRLWGQSASFKSLAVPLGVRAKDDIVYLNLHEKAHGPHGLVAGTTGSGKSEILQSYILSLAVNFHPYEVGFLLIDYKGGGMANLFQNLPHLLGTITNLDGSESMRALASIKSELARRQRIFNESGVNNINQYTKRFKAGEVTCPLPHLFLISDEFAELKKEQPDFMSELVSAARIGRSLGVHLILATQKPSGVVDDQIWSNSKFKLALKVQDESDSNEVLKTPDAARITQPGRSYLQVGNNEIYELFQSAWSGADYSETTSKQGFDGRVYLINALGQGELLNQDLSELDNDQPNKLSQLDVVVNYIHDCYEGMHLEPVERPWLPPLGDQIVNSKLCEASGKDVGKIEGYHLQVALGLVDLPEQQSQVEYIHDFTKDGDFAVFGASGFGKSTVEMEIALSLAGQNSPENVHFYVMDFGNSSLVQLRGLPHTADYLGFDDDEKRGKLLKLLAEELRRRKQLFAAVNALNFTMYNSVAVEKLPAIILFIDNYDVVKEIGMELEEFFTKLTRDGTGVGVYTILSATRASAVRYAVLNNFKNKIAQFMFDSTDITSIVGRSTYKLPEVRGRALVKLQNVSVMQCYLPAPYEDDVSYAAQIGALVDRIAEQNSAKAAEGIKMLPDILTMPMLQQYAEKQRQCVPIGLDTENVEVQYLDLRVPVQLVIGSPQTGKTNLLKLVYQQCGAERVFLADSRGLDFQAVSGEAHMTYMSGAAQAEAFVEALDKLTQARENAFAQQAEGMRPKEFYGTLPITIILIEDADYFVESCKGVEKALDAAMARAINTGVSVVCATLPGRLRGYDNTTKLLKDTQYGILLGNPGDQSILVMQPPRGYKQQIDMAFLYRRGETRLMKLPSAGQ